VKFKLLSLKSKLIIFVVILITYSIRFTPVLAQNSHRIRTNFNREWKFKLGDFSGAEATNFNDSKWDLIGIPHSFSMPYFMSPDFYIGYGWYRKQVVLDSSVKQCKTYLEFEGVFQVAEIYVNGTLTGKHEGGYTGFSIDVSTAVKPGNNTIAVRVNNIWQPGLAPRAGEHVFSGGIYRDVTLVQTNPVHIEWQGFFIKTPSVTERSASVNLSIDVKNATSKFTNITLKTSIFDPLGKLVTQISTNQKLNVGVSTIHQQKYITSPKLWHPDHPNLYTAITAIYQGDSKIDEKQQNFGIRTIEWTSDKGFLINGKHIYLRGANVHQDQAGWGDAVTNYSFYRDIKMMKDAGFNFIRGSHYPHDPSFADACDKLGMLFWSENNFWGIGGSDNTPEGYWNSSAYPTNYKDTAEFNASLTRELKEMIRINRNHPSIIAWSVSNEPFFTAEETLVEMKALLKKQIAVAKAEDPTRPVAVGGAQRPLDSLRIDLIGDIAGYNGDGANIAIFQNPGVPSLVSEYGSVTSERPGKYEPGWGDLSKDSGKILHSWRAGQAIWCGFDHGSIAGSNLGKMGIVDYFRLPKCSWYWYRNEYRGIAPPKWPEEGVSAALKIEADKITAKTDGTDDIWLKISVLDANGQAISNSPDVKLEIVSGPGEFPTGSSITFSQNSDIRIQDGLAAISIRSWHAGTTVIKASSLGLKSSEIKLNFTGDHHYKKGTTPSVLDRPYTKFVMSKLDFPLQIFGRNNPTFASSNAGGIISGYAADGDKKTWWQADVNDASPYWTLDTEKKLALHELTVTFPTNGLYQYKIEVSNDQQSWNLWADCLANQQHEEEKKFLSKDLVGRYVRISFNNSSNAKLAEVKVLGKVLD
jgi:beta-galactosidase